MIKEIRKKTKKSIIETFRISFKRVLIENEVIRLRKDEIRKNENVMQKKMIAKTKKSIVAKKKRIHIEKITIKKRKRKKIQLIKNLKKTSKSKRFYRRRFQIFSVSVFSTL
jgi:hypothetical protein